MNIIINSSILIPIYQQIYDQIKTQIRNGELKENDNLPSVRSLSKDLKISALTVKKAYDCLESDGFVRTIHGKGTYISEVNKEVLKEEQIKDLESDIEKIINKSRRYCIDENTLKEIFLLVLGE